jgi:CRISPR-associated protein Csy2
MILLIPHIRIQAANALTHPLIINAAPIMAVVGWSRSLGLDTKLGVRPTGVGILHHDAQMLGEWNQTAYRFIPQQRRGAVYINNTDYSSKNKYALSLQPTATCHLTVSLVLHFKTPISLMAMERLLAKAKIAGGTVIEHGDLQTFDSEQAFFNSAASRAGFWVIERTDLLEGTDNPMEALIRHIGTNSSAKPAISEEAVASIEINPLDNPIAPTASPDRATSWLAPTTLGYVLITDAENKHQVREGYPHAFAEPLMGLVQYQSARKQTVTAIPYWRQGWLTEAVYVVSQSKFKTN